jgi:predicted TIM-barrel fold metal-dependent hydrolase
MRIITLEEHFVTAEFLKAAAAFLPDNPHLREIRAKLLDLGSPRIAAMDEAGIDLQVLSFAAALGLDKLDASASVALIQDANDQLAAAIHAHPTRYAGFASVALHDPQAAAKELERCIRILGFKGVMVNGTIGGAFLDDPKFTSFFEAVQALEIPVYLHPAPPPVAVREAYYSNLPELCGDLLSRAGWGWHVENGLHCLRLILSGVFDRFPRLKIVIGHMGEDLPYSLARAATVLRSVSRHLQRSIPEYFREHFYITTSGYFTMPPFLCALQVVGADRLMFSVDYPFSTNRQGRDFLDQLPVSPGDLEKIAHGNAERLLQL